MIIRNDASLPAAKAGCQFSFISGTEDRRPMPVRRGGTEDAGHVRINPGLGNFNALLVLLRIYILN
jgi:hypothetical protein